MPGAFFGTLLNTNILSVVLNKKKSSHIFFLLLLLLACKMLKKCFIEKRRVSFSGNLLERGLVCCGQLIFLSDQQIIETTFSYIVVNLDKSKAVKCLA